MSAESAAPSDSLDLTQLNFDACERIGAIVRALQMLEVPAGGRVLDVGGHPGLLASALPRHGVITIDFPASGPGKYVQGSGSCLPFRDQAFEAVVASDTLEHVPSNQRAPFLHELARVAGQHVLVGGPCHSPAVARAEAGIRELTAPSSPAAGWLREHAEYGLPHAQEICGVFEQQGFHVETLPGGDLVRWYTLFALQAMADYIPQGSAAVQNFMPSYNTSFATDEMSTVGYRQLVIASRHPIPVGLSEKTEGREAEAGSQALAQIEALHRLFSELIAGIRTLAAPTEGPAVDAAYVPQLERALSQSGGQTPSLLDRVLRKRKP